MHPKQVSREEFEALFEERIKGEFAHIKRSYRNQQLRKYLILVVSLACAFVSVRLFFPPLIILFLLVLAGLYFLILRKRTKRIDVDQELRRMLFKRVAELSNQPFALHTHQFLSPNTFTESGLFEFPPDQYAGDELIEIGAQQQLGLSQVKVKEERDRFDEKKAQTFDGWLLQLSRLADDRRTDWSINNLNLHGKWKDNLLPNAYYAAGNFGSFYSRGTLAINLNKDAIWDLHRLIMWTLK